LYSDYTRELDGVPVIKCLPYIHLANNLCYTNLAYPQEIYRIMSLLLESFIIVMCDIILNLNSKSEK